MAREIVQERIALDTIVQTASTRAPLDPGVWRDLHSGGWLSVMIPEELGGGGATLGETASVLEAFGTGPVPGPLFETMSLVPAVLTSLGSADALTILSTMANGGLRTTVAASTLSTSGRDDLTLDLPGIELRGGPVRVRELQDATHVMVQARVVGGETDYALIMIDKDALGVSVRPLEGLYQRQYAVTFDRVPLDAAHVVGLDDPTGTIVERATTFALTHLCAFQVGSLAAVFDLALEYSKFRVVFGQPISSYQRVQDHVIDCLSMLDSARWTTNYAMASSAEDSMRLIDTLVAKAVCAESHFVACDGAHEVLAGAGVDLESNLLPHTYLSRGLYDYFGSPGAQRRQIMTLLGQTMMGGEQHVAR